MSRKVHLIALALAAAAIAAPMAQAADRPDNGAGTLRVGTQPVAADTSDVVSRFLRNHAPYGAVLPDVFERYAAAHPYGAALSSAVGLTVVGRPPDIGDAAEAAEAIPLTTSGGFHWGDYSAGVGTGIGFALLLAGALTITPLARRQRTQGHLAPPSTGAWGNHP
jgi:hypothetical protein